MCHYTSHHCMICNKSITSPPLPVFCAAAEAREFTQCKADSPNNTWTTVATTHFGDCLTESSRRDWAVKRAKGEARRRDEREGWWID